MLQLKNVTLARGAKILLERANLLIHANEKIGIVGSNGAGKSSLFAAIRGELEPSSGEIELVKNLAFAEIRQDIPTGAESIIDYVIAGDAKLVQLRKQIQHAEQHEHGTQLAELYQQWADADGYTAESRAAKLLVGLGFVQTDLSRAIDEFSGGWRMRLNLARVLMSPADLLLLDEPTNHLDLEAIVWLEAWLKNLTQTILIISHDREFLDHVVKRIIHFDQGALQSYTGNYSDFEEQYAESLRLQAAAHAAQQQQIKHLQSYVDRFRAKASKARQAQSRMKMIERMDKVAAVQEKNPFQFQFYPAPDVGNPLISFSRANIGYADKIILYHVGFLIYQGDRIALIGPNGAGKSTLIKALFGILPVDSMSKNNKLKIGYFTQHQLEDLHLAESAFWHVKELNSRLPEKDIRQFLGGFNFRDERVFEPIANFSGGEKARLALALLVLQKPNLLLLDEPSNHLDLEMREALAHALQNFEGAMILVTHDRYLIKALADELYLIKNGSVTRFTEELASYEQMILTPTESTPTKQIKEKPTISKPVLRPEKKIEQLEAKLAKQNALLTSIEQQIHEHYSGIKSSQSIEHLLNQQSLLKEEIEQLETDLLDLW